MDHINKVLATSSDDRDQFSLPIRVALVIGKNTPNQYYNNADSSETYHIALSTYHSHISEVLLITFWSDLHPHHKLSYFKTQDWKEQWVDTAHNIIHAEYNHSYSTTADLDHDNDYISVGLADNVHCLNYLFLLFAGFHYQQSQSSDNIFDILPNLAPISSDLHDKLKIYLASDTEHISDGLLWWHERGTTFPCLSHMAQDYLSIPGKSFPLILTFILILLKQLQSTSNAPSAKAAFYLICAAAFLFTQCVPCCALAHVACSTLSMTLTLGPVLRSVGFVGKRIASLRTGTSSVMLRGCYLT